MNTEKKYKSIILIGSDDDFIEFVKHLYDQEGYRIVAIFWLSYNPFSLQSPYNIPIFRDINAIKDFEVDIVINYSKDKEIKNKLSNETIKSEIINYEGSLFLNSIFKKSKKYETETKELLRESKELYSIGLAITASSNLDDALNTILIESCRCLKVKAGSVVLYVESLGLLMLRATHGFSSEFNKVTEWHRRPGGLTDNILKKKIPTVINNIEEHEYVDNKILINEGVKSILAVPLYTEEKVVGILYLDDFKPRNWTRIEIEFITLVGIQAAHAIEKFKLIEELTTTTNYLNNILINSADMIITTDLNGRIVEFNPAGTRLLGYSKDEIVGSSIESLWVEPEKRRALVERIKQESFVSNYNTLLKKKDGTTIEASITLSILRNEHGKIIGTVGISKDITHEKRLLQTIEERNIELQKLNDSLEEKVIERTLDLQKANRELERSSKLKSQFIATMSHELRTPLNSILGFSDLLLDEIFGTLTEKQKRYIHNINNSGNHLLQLINNVLDIAKIESGKMELCYETFDPYQAIKEVETVMKYLIDKKNQKLTILKNADIDFLTADKIKFKQIFYNLLSNSVKFTDDGGSIEVIISQIKNQPAKNTKKHENNLNYLEIIVKDNGIGIKQEDLQRIFIEFEQVDSNLSRRYEGTGLGLSLTKRLIELHGGEIRVESEENKGSIFTVILPIFDINSICKSTEEERLFVDEEDLTKYLSELARGRNDYPLIMIIEDDRSTSELISLHLSNEGYKLSHVFNGAEAIPKIKELKPFAIILDIMIPNKDGWDILQEIKSDPDIKNIPVIIYSIIDNKELGFALGATDFLVKPIDRKLLIDKLNELNIKSRLHKKTTILCIDDNEDTLEYLKEVLQTVDYNVITASSGKKGIESAITSLPDLIVLDIMMPDINGFEVAHILKSKPETSLIPIIIFTAKELTINDRLKLAGKVKKIMQKSHFSSDDILRSIRDFELMYPHRAGLYDEVSGLFDNSYFQLRLAQEINRGFRYKSIFSLLIIDIDSFTDYVKISGIQKANMLIKKYAEFLRKSVRGSDIVVRYGIDEFAIILTNTPKESAFAVAHRFIAYLENYPFYKSDLMPYSKLTASGALLTFPQDSVKVDDMLSKSHELLKKAKAKGGNRIETNG